MKATLFIFHPFRLYVLLFHLHIYIYYDFLSYCCCIKYGNSYTSSAQIVTNYYYLYIHILYENFNSNERNKSERACFVSDISAINFKLC